VIQIGNSKDIGILQSILKQCEIEDQDKSIILKPIYKRNYEIIFRNLGEIDDIEIQEMLKRIDEYSNMDAKQLIIEMHRTHISNVLFGI